jgi:hypothetical protein
MMSSAKNVIIGLICLAVAVALAMLVLITDAQMPPQYAKFWQNYDAAANYLDKVGYNIVILIVVFLFVGLLMLIGEVQPNAEGVIEKKSVLWLKWSLFISAFLVSSTFSSVAIVTWIIGWFVKSDKNWKYALAIVCLYLALFKH